MRLEINCDASLTFKVSLRATWLLNMFPGRTMVASFLSYWLSVMMSDITAAQALSWRGRDEGKTSSPFQTVISANGKTDDHLVESVAYGPRSSSLGAQQIESEDVLDTSLDSLLLNIRERSTLRRTSWRSLAHQKRIFQYVFQEIWLLPSGFKSRSEKLFKAWRRWRRTCQRYVLHQPPLS